MFGGDQCVFVVSYGCVFAVCAADGLQDELQSSSQRSSVPSRVQQRQTGVPEVTGRAHTQTPAARLLRKTTTHNISHAQLPQTSEDRRSAFSIKLSRSLRWKLGTFCSLVSLDIIEISLIIIYDFFFF